MSVITVVAGTFDCFLTFPFVVVVVVEVVVASLTLAFPLCIENLAGIVVVVVVGTFL